MNRLNLKREAFARARDHALFRFLPEVTVAALWAEASLLTLQPGERHADLLRHGERFHLIDSGRVRLFRIAPDQQEKIFDILAAGHLVGEHAIIRPEPDYPLLAEAMTPATLLGLPCAPVAEALASSPGVALPWLQRACETLDRRVGELELMTQQSAVQRLVLFLLNLARDLPSPDHWLELPYSKRLIAHRLAMQPETRIMGGLRAEGLLEVRGNKIRLIHPAHLAARLGG